jgi:hypothetical protein
MQVNVLILDVLRLQCAHRRSFSKATPIQGRAFLEHDADGVNDFLIQAGAAMDDDLTARVCPSAWRMHVTTMRDRAGAL